MDRVYISSGTFACARFAPMTIVRIGDYAFVLTT